MNAEVLAEAGKYGGLAGICVLVAGAVFLTLLKLNIFPKLNQKHTYYVVLAIIGVFGVIALAGIGSSTYVSSNLNQIHGETLRVNAVDTDGERDTTAIISASRGTAEKDKEGRWSVSIPPEKGLKGSKVTVFASNSDEHTEGHREVVLDGEQSQDLDIVLKKNESIDIRGTVQLRDGTRLPGCKVYSSGFFSEASISNEAGEFSIHSHAGKGETIRVSVRYKEKVFDHDVEVGSGPITLTVDSAP